MIDYPHDCTEVLINIFWHYVIYFTLLFHVIQEAFIVYNHLLPCIVTTNFKVMTDYRHDYTEI